MLTSYLSGGCSVEGYKGWRCDSEKVVGWNVMGFGLDVCGFNDDCSYDFWWGQSNLDGNCDAQDGG